jgi:hypothetical protein
MTMTLPLWVRRARLVLLAGWERSTRERVGQPLWIRRARLVLQEAGPYIALLVLPGGTLIALAGWLYRQRPWAVRGTVGSRRGLPGATGVH